MYFQVKRTLKNNCYHNIKWTLNLVVIPGFSVWSKKELESKSIYKLLG
jgi:hypothetical protein